MSTSKRFVSLLMALVLMVGILAVPGMAATGDTAIPHGCSHSNQIVSERYGPWLASSSYSCVHGSPSSRDEKQTRTVYLDYRCADCGAPIRSVSYSTQSRIYCYYQNRVCRNEHEIM